MMFVSSSLEYTSDDLSHSEKDQLPLTKSIKPYANTNVREQTRPQGTAFSPLPLTDKSPHSKTMEIEEEDFSLRSQTITSSTLENLSLSEKNPNRQIRPGDRVKNNIKKQRTDRSSKSSIHQDDRNEKHLSQMKFDPRQANPVGNKRNFLRLVSSRSK